MGVKVFIQPFENFYSLEAQSIVQVLHQEMVDIAIFHGPDIINCMVAQQTKVGLRVLVEHGTQSPYPVFDLAIVSSKEALNIYKEHYQNLNTQVRALPFALNVRAAWEAKPFSRTSLRIPENSLVMTTISTKLDSRLSVEMCESIELILQNVPRSCYAPIGAIKDLSRIMQIFTQYGVEGRFYPLGEKNNPSQYARSMHLYLNEFPEGSCLVMLDAMAAGCPVVTMHDVRGPQQARYGADFMGIERSVTTSKDYVALACELLTNPDLYREWSEHAVKQYEKYADVKGYVNSFEQILIDAWKL